MIKHQKGRDIGKAARDRVAVNAFPGARTCDTIHNSINQQLDQVMLHCGTNDLYCGP